MNKEPLPPLSEQEKEDLQGLLEKLQEQAEEFEVTHPELIDTVNRICVMLSNLGI